MKIIMSNCIEIQEPTSEMRKFCIKSLTHKNPEYEKKKRKQDKKTIEKLKLMNKQG